MLRVASRLALPSDHLPDAIRPSRVVAVILSEMIDSGLVGSTDFGRGTARAEDAQGTPTQSDISPSILVYGE